MQTPLMFELQDLDACAAHLVRHAAESTGDDIFSPTDSKVASAKDWATWLKGCWEREVGEPNWARSWGILESGEVVASVALKGPPTRSARHRVSLDIGVERPWRGKGLGKSLIKYALSWAKREKIEWVDLKVFANNARAIEIYKSLGFAENGRIVDQFRVEGKKIDEISMALKL